jgi:glyoxylase-like metal-dependent hydrolase (beta-lactamase superfamily II)
MKIEANAWQDVPGTAAVRFFPIIPRTTCVSSNCYIFSAPAALVVVDPGASAEQTRQVGRVLTEALAVSPRPVLVFLTHCHQDHSQEAGGFDLPPDVRVTRFAHHAGVEALRARDRSLTVAYLYPWNPPICAAPFEGVLFASTAASEAPAPDPAAGGFPLHTAPIALPDGTTLQRQWLSLGGADRLDVYHAPGHSPCSVVIRVGPVLLLGDLPFAANPGVCGLDGWNRVDLVQTLGKVDWLLDTQDVAVCCPGHGHCVSAPSMQEKLRVMATDASSLTGVPLMDAERVSALKVYVDELLEETAALFTIFSGRLYTVSYYLSLLEEDSAASRLLASLDIDEIDRILSDFRRVADAFHTSAVPEWTIVLKGVQVVTSLQHVLAADHVRQLLDVSLVDRAQRRMEHFLSVVRGLQFLQTEEPAPVNDVIADLLARARHATMATSADLLDAVDDEQAFLQALTRRLAASSPLSAIEFDFAPAPHGTRANIGAKRLDDILTTLLEGMAGTGATHLHLGASTASGRVEIRLSSRDRVDPAAFDQRRLHLYDRTLRWLGGRLECLQCKGSAEFAIALPALESK